MAKKRLVRIQSNHAAEIRREREQQRREAERRRRREARGHVEKRQKRVVLRYRRHMRINGVVAKNKRHAKELFYERLEKRGREMEWEAPDESRPKKRRLVEKQLPGDETKLVAVTTLTDGAERFDHLNASRM